MLDLVLATATGPMIDLSGVDLKMILSEIKSMLPILLPVIIGFIAFRKGLGFLKKQLKGA